MCICGLLIKKLLKTLTLRVVFVRKLDLVGSFVMSVLNIIRILKKTIGENNNFHANPVFKQIDLIFLLLFKYNNCRELNFFLNIQALFVYI